MAHYSFLARWLVHVLLIGVVYGVVNGKKDINERDRLTDFIKWVILDLNFLRKNNK